MNYQSLTRRLVAEIRLRMKPWEKAGRGHIVRENEEIGMKLTTGSQVLS
jgi:hypothetical protein